MARGFLDEDRTRGGRDEVQRSNVIDLEGKLLGESRTGQAYKVDFGDRTVWLAKSQVEFDGRQTFTLPNWLASEKGLI